MGLFFRWYSIVYSPSGFILSPSSSTSLSVKSITSSFLSFKNLDTSIFQELVESGIRVFTYIPKGLEGGISRILYRGTEVIEYSSYIDAIVNAVLKLNEVDKGLAYIYVPYPDQISHRYGVDVLEVKYTIAEILRFLFKVVKKHATTPISIIVTSDHGLVNVDEEDEINMTKTLTSLIKYLLIPPYGDSRASQLKLLDSSYVNEVLELDDIKYLQNYFLIMTRDELVNSGLLVEVNNITYFRIGDLILISKSHKYLYYEYIVSERERYKVKAHHGGLLPEEMYIPLLTITF